MADDVTFPLADGTGLDDPFPFFARCRRESPVLFYAPWNAWFVFKHDDIAALGREPRLSMKRMDLFKMNAPEHLRDRMDFLENDLRTMVVMLDGVDHHRVRAALQQYFTPHMIAAMAPAIARHVETLLDGLEGRASCDIATEVCRKLPLLVLADLFALPPEDFSRLEKWGYDFIEYFNRVPVPESYTLALIDTARDMMAYTRALIAERRSNPGEDLISTLVRGQSQPGGLSDEEIVANVMMVLIAGNDTVGSALGNAVYLLLSHPDELAKVQSGQATWAGVLEETLRYEPANPVIMRKIAEDFDFHGHAFQAGQVCFLVLASGSRDETQIDDPETFNVSRTGTRHMTFGTGLHYCLGAALTHAEALALLPRMFERLSGLRLGEDQPPIWLRTLGVRGPRMLGVRLIA